MQHPLRLIIHVPLREKRDFRQTLVGFKHALCVRLDGPTIVFDLLPTLKPRRGQEHRLILELAEQFGQGWALAVWDTDRLLRELDQVMEGVRSRSPKLLPLLEAAWARITAADEEQFIDLKSFRKFPDGHYVGIIAARENFDFDDYPPRLRRRLIASDKASRPVSEDFWGVLHRLIMTKAEAEKASAAYQRWVRNNRPGPPKADPGKEVAASKEPQRNGGAFET